MIVSINQPAYLPWLGYFHRIAVSDIHVILDDVQFEKNSFTNRNKLRTVQGWMRLTVPVLTSGMFGQTIDEVEINNHENWRHKHLRSIQVNYSKAPFFEEQIPFFEGMYSRQWDRLLALIDFGIDYLLEQLGIKTRIVRSSSLDVRGKKSDLVLEICQILAGDIYLSGELGRNYLKEEDFHKSGIEIAYQDYNHPTYTQCYEPFESHLSVIDLLFNHGPKSLDILMSGQDPIQL